MDSGYAVRGRKGVQKGGPAVSIPAAAMASASASASPPAVELQQQQQRPSSPPALPSYSPTDSSSFLSMSPSPSPTAPYSMGLYGGGVGAPSAYGRAPASRCSFPLPLPLRLLRQSSFGVDEPRTATLKHMDTEDEEEEDTAAEEARRSRGDRVPLMESRAEAVPEEEGGEEELRDEAHSYTLKENHFTGDGSSQLQLTERCSALSEERLPSPSARGVHAVSPRVRPAPASHTYYPLVTPVSIRISRAPRVFHSFLLISLCAMMSVSELCVYMARVCKQWQRHAHDALAHPSRRMGNYAATGGGGALFAELQRLSSVRGIRQRMDAMSSDIHAVLHARHRREVAAQEGDSVDAQPVASSVRRAPVPSNQVPSVTLLQHLQLLPDNGSSASTENGSGLMLQFKRMLPGSVAPLTRLLDSHCLLLATHLVHLRVLRIYNGSGISNDGIKLLAHGLRHLRILHIGHLSDTLIDDRSLHYISESMRELHSLWLTQDTDIPQRTLWNPHPRLVYNLFSSPGVASLKQLHQTLHHVNLGGFKNLTTQGLRLLSTGDTPLHLQSVHLNGWHILDDCITLLHTHHASSLYHLHLFDVCISNEGMRSLALLHALETLLLDHCNDIDAEGIEMFVDESKKRVGEVEAEQLEQARKAAVPYAISVEPVLPPAVSLLHLELHSCARITLDALPPLALHPTLRSLDLSGRVLSHETDERAAEAAIRQVEELSAGRLVVNGGRRRRRRAAARRR